MHPALELIRQRHEEGSLPGHRTDDFKLGVVVEGGGMQGIISGAMLLRINELGLHNVFDSVYGASAGAVNGAYFLAKQNVGLDVYTEQCVDDRFLDLSLLLPEPVRSWAGSIDSSDGGDVRAPMDLDYLIHHVMEHENPIDWDAILNSPIPLKVVASSLDLLRPITIADFKDKAELQLSLAASATVPEVFEPVPVASAIEDGCTHCLVLCTRLPREQAAADTQPRTRRVRAIRRLAKKAIDRIVKRTVLNPGYMKSAWRSARSDVGYIHDELLYAAHYQAPEQAAETLGAFVMPLYPSSTRGISPICQDPAKLIDARQEGVNTIDRLVAHPLGLDTPPTMPARVAAQLARDAAAEVAERKGASAA